MANNSGSSCEEDEVFTSQFAALLKPIRELTKQTCWELDIAEKLDEYVHYIQDLPIEVNLNGEAVKLDFAKAAMVVQNSVQIYSKKVETLWILLQDVISFLSSHKDASMDDQSNPISKLKRSQKKRTMKENIDLLDDAPLKLRKLGIKPKKKNTLQPMTVVSLPFGILQLEEAISSFNSFKIKIFSNLKEHLGYPSDLRSNFVFDNMTLFLSINPNSCRLPGIVQNSTENGTERTVNDILVTSRNDDDDYLHAVPMEEPNVSFGENDVPFTNVEDRKSISRSSVPYDNGTSLSRQPSPAPKIVLLKNELQDPWQGLEPYVDDKGSNKPCGPPVQYKLPKFLQKKKKEPTDAGKKESIIYIDQYLGAESVKKKFLFKEFKPDDEFWEDYIYAMKTLMPVIVRKRPVKPEKTQKEELPLEEVSTDEEVQGYRDDLPFDDGWNQEDIPPQTSLADGDMEDDSKQFFELVQQYMTEYTASAKGFVHSSESMKRVQAWHEMIQPRLQEAESRRDFDIHQYGSQIIEEFGSDASLGSTCFFANLVRKKTKGEVARYFLATLQLANAYNVEILPDANLSTDRIELKLISRKRHHEQVEEFHS